MILYVTEAQQQLWNSYWYISERNDNLIVTTQMNFFRISPESFEVSTIGEDITIDISTDQDYTLDISDPEWITLISGEGIKEGKLIFRIDENTTGEERSGMIVFRTETNSCNVEIMQYGD